MGIGQWESREDGTRDQKVTFSSSRSIRPLERRLHIHEFNSRSKNCRGLAMKPTFIASVHELLRFHWTKTNQQCLNTTILFVLMNVLLFLFLLSSSPSLCLRQGVYVCVNLCLLNITEIRAGGLIKKQLPLVPHGRCLVEGNSANRKKGVELLTMRHAKTHKLHNCLQN